MRNENEKCVFAIAELNFLGHRISPLVYSPASGKRPVPEFIDPVFAKTSPKRSFCMTENKPFERPNKSQPPLKISILARGHLKGAQKVFAPFKSQDFSLPTPSNGPRYGFSLIKIIISRNT